MIENSDFIRLISARAPSEKGHNCWPKYESTCDFLPNHDAVKNNAADMSGPTGLITLTHMQCEGGFTYVKLTGDLSCPNCDSNMKVKFSKKNPKNFQKFSRKNSKNFQKFSKKISKNFQKFSKIIIIFFKNKHGFHVHQKQTAFYKHNDAHYGPNTGNDCSKAQTGGHFFSGDQVHGPLNGKNSHNGAMGNIIDDNGHISVYVENEKISLDPRGKFVTKFFDFIT